ncbi:hypothetical protein M422DRAFT_250444 [Sphaerobolus stellatus SS14]|uniref:Uncharacterized protein n=1 Tax=Sphaerobolus stellatus (strain SS14) TaxID=990650 RepID=A0A0C9VG86_SPHS4|nr:hypothetical protein M422DRAFT_250444 [Sphaerobolus stellatus SS14]
MSIFETISLSADESLPAITLSLTLHPFSLKLPPTSTPSWTAGSTSTVHTTLLNSVSALVSTQTPRISQVNPTITIKEPTLSEQSEGSTSSSPLPTVQEITRADGSSPTPLAALITEIQTNHITMVATSTLAVLP